MTSTPESAARRMTIAGGVLILCSAVFVGLAITQHQARPLLWAAVALSGVIAACAWTAGAIMRAQVSRTRKTD